MDYDGQAQVFRQRQLVPQAFFLHIAGRKIIEIIETYFPDGLHIIVLRHLLEAGEVLILHLLRVVGVGADGGIEEGVIVEIGHYFLRRCSV